MDRSSMQAWKELVVPAMWVQIPAPLLSNCLVLDKLLNLSEPPPPYLQSGFGCEWTA